MKFKDIKIGDVASIAKVFTPSDVEIFAKISLDKNPVHLDEEFAKNTIFGKRIVPGFLVGSLISAVIANKLPGNGSIYMNQTMQFCKPIFIDDEVTARVEVIALRSDKSIVTLKTQCINEMGIVVIDGQAVIKLLENE